MIFLVDANVLSEPTKPAPDPAVVKWLRHNEGELAVDPIILGEMRFGILLLPPGTRKTRLEGWFADLAQRIHCLPWDRATGLRWAELLADLRLAGLSMPVKDSQIAATVLTYDLTLATRNRQDFKNARVPLVDPFAPAR